VNEYGDQQAPPDGGVNEYGDQQPPSDSWGAGDADPWSEAGNNAGDAGEGASGVGDWISSFFD
jgi:hypothetical protein